jgi:hypothetical protein
VGTTYTIPPRGKGRFAFVVRLRDGGKPFTYGGLQLVPGVCYLCDPVFHRSGTTGETLGIGHQQIRVEAHATGHKTVSRRFDVYVPRDSRKALWVVPRGDRPVTGPTLPSPQHACLTLSL